MRRVLEGALLSDEDRQHLERAALNLASFGRLRQTVLRVCKRDLPEASDILSQQIMRVLHLKDEGTNGDKKPDVEAAGTEKDKVAAAGWHAD